MLANRTKLITSVSLAILLCIFGCVGLAEVAQKGSAGQAPLRSLRIMIDESQREQFFAQLRKFADKHDFEILIRQAGPNGEGFFIEMLRDDLYINATITRVDPKIVSLGVYDEDPSRPTQEETIDTLIRDLQSFIRDIPNVTITEQ